MVEKFGEQRWLITELIGASDTFLLRVRNNAGTECYKLYTGNMIPMRFVASKTFDPPCKFFKRDKKKRYTLNLSTIRTLHGNHWIKKLYKNNFNEKIHHLSGDTQAGVKKIIAGGKQKKCSPCTYQSPYKSFFEGSGADHFRPRADNTLHV